MSMPQLWTNTTFMSTRESPGVFVNDPVVSGKNGWPLTRTTTSHYYRRPKQPLHKGHVNCLNTDHADLLCTLSIYTLAPGQDISNTRDTELEIKRLFINIVSLRFIWSPLYTWRPTFNREHFSRQSLQWWKPCIGYNGRHKLVCWQSLLRQWRITFWLGLLGLVA